MYCVYFSVLKSDFALGKYAVSADGSCLLSIRTKTALTPKHHLELTENLEPNGVLAPRNILEPKEHLSQVFGTKRTLEPKKH